MGALFKPNKDTDDMNNIQKHTRRPKTTITIRISYDAYDKLEYLSKLYKKSFSQLVETSIIVMYDALVSGAKKVKEEVEK